MKKLLLVISMLMGIAYGQSILYFRGDTSLFYKVGGYNELKLQNSTKDSLGPLVNFGNGITHFMTWRRVRDSIGGSGVTNVSQRQDSLFQVKAGIEYYIGKNLINAGDLANFFSTTEINGGIIFSTTNAGAHRFWGNNTGSTGVPGYSLVKDDDLTLSDITVNNSDISNHGFLKKLNNDATYYMDGTGNWSIPAGGSSIDTTGAFVNYNFARNDSLFYAKNGVENYFYRLFGTAPISVSNGGISLNNNGVTDAKLRQSAGLSVIGRSANSTGNVADITAATDNNVLRRSGTSIGWGAINLASSDAVTGVLPIANGGTNNGSLSVTNQNLIIADGSKLIGLTKGNNGQHLIVNGSGNLAWGDTTAMVNIYNSDGTLTGTRTVNTGGFATTWTGANTNAVFTVTNTQSGYGALYATSNGGTAVQGVSTNGGRGGSFFSQATTTATTLEVLSILRGTTGTPANGIAARFTMAVQRSDGVYSNAIAFDAKLTDVTAGSEASELDITGKVTGSNVLFMNMQTGGIVRVNNNADTLATRSWARANLGGGGGSGEVNTASNLGGGLANYDSKSGVDLRFNSFLATDFNLASNLISIDYTNGQAASGSVKGFLTSADWTTFNNKQATGLGWLLAGNAIAGGDFIGSTNNLPLIFKVNNVQSGYIGVANTNTGFGYNIFGNLTSGINNVAMGMEALKALTSGSGNIALGQDALFSNTTGGANISLGSSSLFTNIAGSYNVAVGDNALTTNTATNNVGVGYQALGNNSTGNSNTAVGSNAGLNLTTGYYNVFIGDSTGLGITTGPYNTIIGAQVTGLSPTLSNNIIIADGQGNQRINVNSSGHVTERLVPRLTTAASYTTSTTINADANDLYIITAQAGALLFNAPSGTPASGQVLKIWILDDGTARALTWNAIFRGSTDLALPSTTTISKGMKLYFEYNLAATKWDLVGQTNGF